MNQSTDELIRAPRFLRELPIVVDPCEVIVDVKCSRRDRDRRCDGKSDGEDRSTARLAFNVDVAIEQLGELAAHSETQAGSPV